MVNYIVAIRDGELVELELGGNVKEHFHSGKQPVGLWAIKHLSLEKVATELSNMVALELVPEKSGSFAASFLKKYLT